MIGYVVGILILGPLLIKLFSYFQVNHDVDKYVGNYIQNSQVIPLELNITYNMNDFRKYVSSYRENHSSGKFTFYSEKDKKNFVILQYGSSNVWNVTMFERKTANKILATVNRSEMSDPSFGTDKKPIAILKFSIENLDPSLDSTVLNTSQNQYRFNVHEYLMYTMGHSDFNRMLKK